MDRQVLRAAETVLKRAPLPCVLYWSARIAIATAIYILLFYTVLVETFQGPCVRTGHLSGKIEKSASV